MLLIWVTEDSEQFGEDAGKNSSRFQERGRLSVVTEAIVLTDRRNDSTCVSVLDRRIVFHYLYCF